LAFCNKPKRGEAIAPLEIGQPGKGPERKPDSTSSKHVSKSSSPESLVAFKVLAVKEALIRVRVSTCSSGGLTFGGKTPDAGSHPQRGKPSGYTPLPLVTTSYTPRPPHQPRRCWPATDQATGRSLLESCLARSQILSGRTHLQERKKKPQNKVTNGESGMFVCDTQFILSRLPRANV
jgi:hypothetical protein